MVPDHCVHVHGGVCSARMISYVYTSSHSYMYELEARPCFATQGGAGVLKWRVNLWYQQTILSCIIYTQEGDKSKQAWDSCPKLAGLSWPTMTII